MKKLATFALVLVVTLTLGGCVIFDAFRPPSMPQAPGVCTNEPLPWNDPPGTMPGQPCPTPTPALLPTINKMPAGRSR